MAVFNIKAIQSLVLLLTTISLHLCGLSSAIQTTVNLLRVGSPPPHKEARQKRKELREKLLAEQEELERQMKELQIANENKQQELERVRKVGAAFKFSAVPSQPRTS